MFASTSRRLTQAFMAVVVAVALAGVFGLATTQTAHAASVKASSSTTAKATKFASYKATTGSTKSSAKPLASIKIKGISGLTYTANKAKAKTGKATKAQKSGIEYVTVKLPASKAKTYDVYYRVYLKGYGWMGWAKNGAKAGSKGNKMYITALNVKLVKKTAAKPNTDRAAYAGKNGFVKKITGNATADALIKKWAKAGKMDLLESLKQVRKNLPYFNLGFKFADTSAAFTSNLNLVVNTTIAKKKSDGTYRGDCFAHTAFGHYMAKYLGYKSSVAAGHVVKVSNKYKHEANGDIVVDENGEKVLQDLQVTSWLNVVQEGQTSIYDVTNMFRSSGGKEALYPARCVRITATAPTFTYPDAPEDGALPLFGQFKAL